MRGVCTPHVEAGEGEAATDSDFHPETANCSERGVCDTHCVCMSGGPRVGEGLVQAGSLRRRESDVKFVASITCVKSCLLE